MNKTVFLIEQANWKYTVFDGHHLGEYMQKIKRSTFAILNKTELEYANDNEQWIKNVMDNNDRRPI